MTEPTTEPTVAIVTDPSPRLVQLQQAYAQAKADAQAAKERLDLIVTGIKTELTAATFRLGERDRIELPCRLDAPGFSLAKVETWRLDTARLKRDDLPTYVRYARKSESWTLRVVTRSGDDA